MLTFLSPLFLVGLASAAIPLLIHLSRSRRTKTMKFSTTRFFTDQFLRSYRMSRLKELLLLACRMALCALLATAMARPLLLPRGLSSPLGGSRSVVLVLDDSASMGLVEDGRTLLDRARVVARELIEGLRPGDTASVVLAGRRAGGPEVLFPRAVPELGDVLQAVNSARVATLGTDLSGALAKAEAIALSSGATSKEVYVLSDLQDGGWSQPDAADRPRGEALFFFVPLKPKAAANLAVTAVQYAAARPMAGVPFSIRPHVVVLGDRGATADVRLVVDGKPVAERRLERLGDGRWAVPRFDHTFEGGGWHTGYVEVPDPSLPQDNRRYFAFEVLDSVRVLAVDGAPSKVPRLDELFFLKLALTAGAEGRGAIRVDTVSPGALTGSDLGRYPLVVLANVESLPAPAVEALESFADRGGSVLVFLGDRVGPAFYNSSLWGPARLHGGLMPGRLLGREGDPAGTADVATVGEVSDAHPALVAFHDPQFARLAGVGFKALWGIEPDPSASVPLRANTGAPLLVEKPFGRGRVMAFASSCDRDWTNFPVRPAYLPWIHRLVGYLAQEPLGRSGFFATGEAVPMAVSASEGLTPLSVRRPDGSLAQPTASDDPDHPLVFADTSEAGVYTVVDLSRKAEGRAFAVNLAADESDLTYLDDLLADRGGGPAGADRAARVEAGLRELLPGRPSITYVADPAQAPGLALGARRGRPLWDLALWSVLLISLVEPWLANRISVRHYGRPRELPAIFAGNAARS